MACRAPVLGDQGLVTSLSVSAYPLVSENHVSTQICRKSTQHTVSAFVVAYEGLSWHPGRDRVLSLIISAAWLLG